jgi:Tectonin domain
MKRKQLPSTINYNVKSTTTIHSWRSLSLALALTAALLLSLAPAASAKTLVAGPPLVQIAAGNTQVWGLDAAGNIYQYKGGTFNLIPGNFKQIAVGLNDDVWGLGPKGHAFQYDFSSKSFNEVSSSLTFKQIATGKAGTWAITSAGAIYYDTPVGFQEFTQGPPPAALEVFVGGAGQAVWILDFGQEPHLLNTRTGFFDLVPGVNLQQIAAGYSDTWGLDFSGQPRLYHPSKPFAFNVVPSVPLAQLALTSEAEFWAISEADHAVYHYNPVPSPGSFDLEDDKEIYTQITAGNSTIGVWALTNTHKIYKF